MHQETRLIKLFIFAACTLLASCNTTPFPMIENQPLFCVYAPRSPQVPSPPSFHFHPPPFTKPEHGVWCVAKPTVPSPLLQIAMDYACSSGAECGPIQLKGSCYQPDTMIAHASYAFNSYWQNMKRSGGTCEFGGMAMLVTVDPSYDQCHFTYKT